MSSVKILLHCLIALSIFSCAATNPATQASNKNVKVYSGTLAYYDDFSGTFIVENANRKQKEFVLADTAKIFKDGQASKLNTVDLDRSVTVFFTNKGGRSIALQVRK
jgi:beta-lactamase class D